MNIIGIDPSLISTALIVATDDDFKIFNYCRESSVFSKKGITKWFKSAEQYVTYRYVKYNEFKDYSEGEITKLKDYDKITDDIIKDILDNIDTSQEIIIGIEGYNFAAQAGDIIDLVTFSTLLRKKLYDDVSKNIIVLSPSTLKLEACKLCYEPIRKEIGIKKIKIVEEYRNNLGIPGGKFLKTDMCRAIVECEKLTDYWANHCRSIKDELLKLSNIPKPYEDVNDCYLLYQILKRNMGNYFSIIHDKK